AHIDQQIVGDLAGPKCLQDIRRLDLPPGCLWAHQRRVPAEKTVLLVVKPNKTKFVFWIDLPVAAQVRIRLVGCVGDGVTSSNRKGNKDRTQVVAPIRTEEPQSVPQQWSARAGGRVAEHYRWGAGPNRGTLVSGKLRSGFQSVGAVVSTQVSVQVVG